MHLQLAGDLPYCVLGWRHYDDTSIEPDLIGVYGPVHSEAMAEDLAKTLADAVPGIEGLTRYTVMPTYPVTLTPVRVDSAVADR